MDKIQRLFPSILFAAYFLKVMFAGATYADAPILAIAMLLIVGSEYKARDKRIQALEEQLSETKKTLSETKTEIDQVKTHVSGLKLASQRFSTNGR